MPTKPSTPYTRHPATYGPARAHLLEGRTEDGSLIYVWRTTEGGLVLQNDECDILIPAHALRALAEAALAVHVHNGRPDAKASTP